MKLLKVEAVTSKSTSGRLFLRSRQKCSPVIGEKSYQATEPGFDNPGLSFLISGGKKKVDQPTVWTAEGEGKECQLKPAEK